MDETTQHLAQMAQTLLERREEIERLREENRELRECLEGMAWQFGHEFEQDGQRWLGTMGLSDLEWAFEVLGWDEPHPFPVEEATQAERGV